MSFIPVIFLFCFSARGKQRRKIWLCEYCWIVIQCLCPIQHCFSRLFFLNITFTVFTAFISGSLWLKVCSHFATGHELHEQTGRKWVCGFQQCHVSTEKCCCGKGCLILVNLLTYRLLESQLTKAVLVEKPICVYLFSCHISYFQQNDKHTSDITIMLWFSISTKEVPLQDCI